MTDTKTQISVAVVDSDSTFSAILGAILSCDDSVSAVLTFQEPHKAQESFDGQEAVALFIDLFTCGIDAGIDLIEHVRKNHPEVPICLLGTQDNLLRMPNVPESWKQRFAHYYKMPKDQLPDQLQAVSQAIIERLVRYWLGRRAQVGLKDLRELVITGSSHPGADTAQQRQIEQIVDLAQSALDEKIKPPYSPILIPGIPSTEAEAVIKKTILDASKALERTARVNSMVLWFGAIMIFLSFVVASYSHLWQGVAFGGMGLTGIVASLVLTPLKSIGMGARRIVQLQVAYVSFLNQVALLNCSPGPDDVLERSRQFDSITRSLQETLEKYYGE